jgi:hypothetical protein
MKIIVYYLVLLVFIGILAGFLISPHPGGMSMPTMISISVLLGIYAVAMSLVGEGRSEDEREASHRYFANRMAMIAGMAVLSAGILYQIFTHRIDYWLLAGLIAINFVKIVSLIYSSYRK